MKRRDFITLLGGAAVVPVVRPLTASAQQPPKISRVGMLLYSNVQADPQSDPFRRGLRDLGYTEGQNLAMEYRYADGVPERLPSLASELVQLKPDVLVAIGGDVAPSVVNATRSVPVVFAMSADPVQLGIVASLSRPGGNATGVTFLQDDLASKRLELIKEAAPHISRVGFLWNPDHRDNELREAERAARTLGVQLQRLEMRGPGDLDRAFRAITAERPEALYVVSSRHTVLNLPSIVDFATKNRLPLAGGWGAWARSGGVLSYGPNIDEMVARSSNYVDRILKGAKPADLPVEQPTRFELIINLKSAKALGLALPESFLLRADEVIE
jgi:putative ABC transport system substrate-binding protein